MSRRAEKKIAPSFVYLSFVSMHNPQSYTGRGAGLNLAGRFETVIAEIFDDGWDSLATGAEAARIPTTLQPEVARTLITSNASPDIPFDASINPYRGCEHGCPYCYARPNHAYVGLSPGLDFESRVIYKANAVEALTRQLQSAKYRPAPIAIGAATDPYQPAERKLRITRGIIETLARHRQPFSIITKNALIVRDADLIAPLAAAYLARVYISVTTLDSNLARRLEPRASAPATRLNAIRTLSAAGVPVGAMLAPIIPGLNDEEMERILDAVQEAGATSAGYVMLRLPFEVKTVFRDWLDREFPERKERILRLVHALRGGADYDSRFGARMRGAGRHADLYARRFQLAATRLGLNRNQWDFDLSQFRRYPGAAEQLSLFRSPGL